LEKQRKIEEEKLLKSQKQSKKKLERKLTEHKNKASNASEETIVTQDSRTEQKAGFIDWVKNRIRKKGDKKKEEEGRNRRSGTEGSQ
jgi:hypothetical protein